MRIIGIIPARMGSSRFPGKPLKEILGMPMIGHVYFRAAKSKTLNGVWLATCDEEIKRYADSIGAPVVMTSSSHESASDRVAEAAQKIELLEGKRADIIVMIQGDEPLIYPDMVDGVVQPLLADNSIQVTNLVAPIKSLEDFNDPNEVKVVTDANGDALLFSREPIPSQKKLKAPHKLMKKQVCIIAFRRASLFKFVKTARTPLEIIEGIDMLRILENCGKVRMSPTERETCSVDTPEDLEGAERILKACIAKGEKWGYLSRNKRK